MRFAAQPAEEWAQHFPHRPDPVAVGRVVSSVLDRDLVGELEMAALALVVAVVAILPFAAMDFLAAGLVAGTGASGYRTAYTRCID